MQNKTKPFYASKIIRWQQELANVFFKKAQTVKAPDSVETIQLCRGMVKVATGHTSMECLCFSKTVFRKTRGGLELAQGA